MARFLVVAPPLTGHVLPMSALLRGLLDRGHELAWATAGSDFDDAVPPGVEHFASPARPGGGRLDLERYRSARGLEGLRWLLEDILVPLTRAMTPAVEAAIGAFRPDLVVVEHLAWAGGMAARKAGVPWATVAASLGGRRFAAGEVEAVEAWIAGWLERLQREQGLEPVPDPEDAPALNLVLTSRRFVGEERSFPASYHFVGPVTRRAPDPTPFPFDRLGEGRRVLVSLGSTEAVRGGAFYDAVARGLEGLDVRVVVVAPPGQGPFPDGFIVRSWVPQLELLREMDAVLTHGGANTVHEALAQGLPLVVAPIVNDQSWVAARVVATGAGLRVSFGRPRPDAIREAVERVLGEPSFREGAEALARSFVEEGGLDRAVELLEAEAAAARG